MKREKLRPLQMSHEERMARVVQLVKDNPSGIYLPKLKFKPVWVPIEMPATNETKEPQVSTTE
jgi:hypothetical protein